MYTLTREVGNCIAVRLSGRLSLHDLRQMASDLERLTAAHPSVRLLLELEGFRGWGVESVPLELRLDAQFGEQVELIAVVGQASWQRRMTDVMKTLVRAEVRFFDESAQHAWYWLLAC